MVKNTKTKNEKINELYEILDNVKRKYKTCIVKTCNKIPDNHILRINGKLTILSMCPGHFAKAQKESLLLKKKLKSLPKLDNFKSVEEIMDLLIVDHNVSKPAYDLPLKKPNM